MKEQGVDATSVEVVMREAGLTVGGFYAHFASKEALAHEAMLAGMEASVTGMLAGRQRSARRQDVGARP